MINKNLIVIGIITAHNYLKLHKTENNIFSITMIIQYLMNLLFLNLDCI